MSRQFLTHHESNPWVPLPLLGPPSHVGGRHLGPFFYYVTTFFFWITGQDILLSHACYSCFLLTGIIGWFLVARSLFKSTPVHSDRTAAVLICTSIFVTAITTAPVIELFRYFWEPHFFIVYVPFFILAFLEWCKKKRNSGVIFLIFASSLLQLHYSAAVPVAAAFFVGLFVRKYSRTVPSTSKDLLSAFVLCTVCLLLWLPTAWYAVMYGVEFITATYRGLAGDSHEFHAKIFFSEFIFNQNSFLRMFLSKYSVFRWIGCALLLIVTSVGLRLAYKERNVQAIGYAALFFVSICGYCLLFASLKEEVHQYYMYPLIFVCPFLFSFACTLIVKKQDSVAFHILFSLFLVGFAAHNAHTLINNRRITGIFTIANTSAIARFIHTHAINKIDLKISVANSVAPVKDSVYYFLGSDFTDKMSDIVKMKELYLHRSRENSSNSASLQSEIWSVICPVSPRQATVGKRCLVVQKAQPVTQPLVE